MNVLKDTATTDAPQPPLNIVVIVHYFPPINSSGAKRWEYMTKYLARLGHNVTVITSRKTGSDGEFTESIPPLIRLIELNRLGNRKTSVQGAVTFSAMYDADPPLGRKIKQWIQTISGQIPDPRLSFALSFAGPLELETKKALESADVVIGSCPPWPMLLAASIAAKRFHIPLVLDYRDQFSDNFEMPGSQIAKRLERMIDRRLCRDANRVVAISPPMAQFYKRYNNRSELIVNGFDHEVFNNSSNSYINMDERRVVTIRYMGLVTPRCIPTNFLVALRELKLTDRDLYQRICVEYYGSYSLMKDTVQRQHKDIADRFSFFSAVPYRESVELMKSSDYLLFCDTSDTTQASSKGTLTTKLYEYIASERPIIAEIEAATLPGQLLRSASQQHLVSTSRDAFARLFKDPTFYTPPPSLRSPVSPLLTRESAAFSYEALLRRVITNDQTVATSDLTKLFQISDWAAFE
jgi:glycosyltransferase involved in cell wall biosynthesis